MSGQIGFGDFYRDAQLHNPWWVGDTDELAAVSDLVPRSNTYSLLEAVDESLFGEGDTRVFPQYGPSGVGKTTMLKHLAATCIDAEAVGIDVRTEDLDRDELRVENALDPNQVLYVPVEDSLYHLQSTADAATDRAALERLGDTIEQFSRRHGGRCELVLIDDLGALEVTPEERAKTLLRYADDGRAIVVTGALESHVEFPESGGEVGYAFAQLPRKFIDVAKTEAPALRETLLAHQAGDEGLIRAVRDRLGDPLDDRDDGGLDEVVESLELLYFDVLDRSDRRDLDRIARRYFEHGGFFYETHGEGTGIREALQANELVESALELFLYRDVAHAHSISEPRNLHKICAYAARRHDEYEFKRLSNWLGVDRRTVKDRYLRILDDSTVLNQAPDYGLVRQHRTRLHLQNPRHAILLSQRQAHKGFAPTYRKHQPDPEFEGFLARTVAFDHAERLQFSIGDATAGDANDERQVEYARTDEGIVDAVLRRGRFVYPVALAYDRSADDAEAAVRAFDPTTGKHRAERDAGGRSIETLDLAYTSPLRFVVHDSLPYELESRERLVDPADGPTVCHVPLWLFMLIG